MKSQLQLTLQVMISTNHKRNLTAQITLLVASSLVTEKASVTTLLATEKKKTQLQSNL
jgi:hypothetical protein